MLNRVSVMVVMKGEDISKSVSKYYFAKKAKGVNFLEYALLAMMVVGLFAIIYAVFKVKIKALVDNIFSSGNTATNSVTTDITNPTR